MKKINLCVIEDLLEHGIEAMKALKFYNEKKAAAKADLSFHAIAIAPKGDSVSQGGENDGDPAIKEKLKELNGERDMADAFLKIAVPFDKLYAHEGLDCAELDLICSEIIKFEHEKQLFFLLDLILFDQGEEDFKRLKAGQSILSTALYNHFKDRIIAYTDYGGEYLFQTKWIENYCAAYGDSCSGPPDRNIPIYNKECLTLTQQFCEVDVEEVYSKIIESAPVSDCPEGNPIPE